MTEQSTEELLLLYKQRCEMLEEENGKLRVALSDVAMIRSQLAAVLVGFQQLHLDRTSPAECRGLCCWDLRAKEPPERT